MYRSLERFDANQNGTLDPPERSALRAAFVGDIDVLVCRFRLHRRLGSESAVSAHDWNAAKGGSRLDHQASRSPFKDIGNASRSSSESGSPHVRDSAVTQTLRRVPGVMKARLSIDRTPRIFPASPVCRRSMTRRVLVGLRLVARAERR